MIELLFEILLQVFVEFFGDAIVHLLPTERRTWNAILAFIGYAAAGVAIGYLTVLVFPVHFISDPLIRWINLALTPIAIGALMSWVGRVRRNRDQRVVGLERFVYAYVFALAIALTRFLAAA